MARTDPTVYMKLPQELKTVLESAAAENRRSLTAEIVARLQQTFDPRDEASPALDFIVARWKTDALASKYEKAANESTIHTLARLLLDALTFAEAHTSPTEREEINEIKKLAQQAFEETKTALADTLVFHDRFIKAWANLDEMAAAKHAKSEVHVLGSEEPSQLPKPTRKRPAPRGLPPKN